VRREGRPLSDTPKSYRHIVRILGRGAEKRCGALWTEGLDASVAAIGRLLFTEYAFPFEVTSILILVAMIGAIVLAKREL